jgi:glycosyltransferase involved in cell wall biosynthesis
LYAGHIRFRAILGGYMSRLYVMLRSQRFDLVWVEKEILPWLPHWLEDAIRRGSAPMVVDYDDAVFHRYDQHRSLWIRKWLGRKIDEVMRSADLVIVGNDYLGDRARKAGARRVEWLPTVVDTSRYAVSESSSEDRAITIGWIGSPSTARYLHLITPALKTLVHAGVRIVTVGANAEELEGLPIEVRPWSEENEVTAIQEFDIGIMPLADGPFENGKCGYKLIQYMACGKPVVASPVGMNKVIVRDGVEGFLASSISEWCEGLSRLARDRFLRNQMGKAGRMKVESEYSLRVMAPRLEGLLRSVCEGAKDPC